MKTFLAFTTILIFSLFGCSSHPKVGGGRSIPVPVISGTIVSIQPGNPSYATLKDIRIVESKNSPELERLSGNTFKLPNGHFISKDHWQSEGDTLDLFIGDQLADFTKVGKISDVSSIPLDPMFDGIVKSINDDKLVIQKVFMVFDKDYAFKGMRISNEETTIHIAPYTSVTLNGEKKIDSSQIKEGDPILFILIGPPHDLIATHITDFHSLKAVGWKIYKQ